MMSDEHAPETQNETAAIEPMEDGAAPAITGDAREVQAPEFAPLVGGSPDSPAPVDRFFDVDVVVWAELGRITLPLGELMKLGPNSVVKLNRSVSAPVDLMAQGVRFAVGEVVVIEDRFAVRIKEIENPRRTDAA